MFREYSNKVEVKLDELILENGNIDGEKMEENWFPSVDADIFLSHSHKNEKDAIILSSYLFDKLNIKTFVDSCIWGYSDNLLKDLDNRFCKRTDGNYNYIKRNFATSNVHMMLSTALTKMIDKTECIFFLNTPESISFKEGTKFSTQSPWIYAEIEISKLIRRRERYKHRESRATNKTFSNEEDVSLNESFEYPLDLNHLTVIDNSNIIT